jgi:hypothetical protein
MKLTSKGKWRNTLFNLLRIQSHSSNETLMILHIIKFLDGLNLPYSIDSTGNILVVKGKALTYPCICAHMDTVHQFVNKIALVNYKNKLHEIFGKDGENKTGIGGDDKCGIFACMYFLYTLPAVKVVFFTKEERGCVGSRGINLSFFDDCQYLLQLDRKGNHDLIQKLGGDKTTSKQFRQILKPIKDKYKFKPASGSVTDVMRLFDRGVGKCCLNISSGYFKPHTDKEYIDLEGLSNSINFTNILIRKLGTETYRYKKVVAKVISFVKTTTTTATTPVTTTLLTHKAQTIPCDACGYEMRKTAIYVLNKQNVCWQCYKIISEYSVENKGTIFSGTEILRDKILNNKSYLKGDQEYFCWTCSYKYRSRYCWECGTRYNVLVPKNDNIQSPTGYTCFKCNTGLKKGMILRTYKGELHCPTCIDIMDKEAATLGKPYDINCEVCGDLIVEPVFNSKWYYNLLMCSTCHKTIKDKTKELLNQALSFTNKHNRTLSSQYVHKRYTATLKDMFYCSTCKKTLLIKDIYPVDTNEPTVLKIHKQCNLRNLHAYE